MGETINTNWRDSRGLIAKEFLSLVAVAVFIYSVLHFFFGQKLGIPPDAVHIYSPAAVNLLEGRGYTLNGEFLTKYPPLFSLFIALVYLVNGNHSLQNQLFPFAVILLQACSATWIFFIGNAVGGRGCARLSWTLVLTYPFFAVLGVTQYVWNAMPLFMFFFFPSIYFFIKGAQERSNFKLLLSGFLLGLSGLVWPAVVGLWIVFAVFAAVSSYNSDPSKLKKAFVSGLCVILGFWIPVSAWSIYVYQKTGKKIVLADGQMLSVRDGLLRKNSPKFAQYEFVQDARSLRKRGGLRSLSEVAGFYINEFKLKPGETAKFVMFKMLRPWYANDSEKNEGVTTILQLPYLLMGYIGACLMVKRKNFEATFLLSVIAYFWLVSFAVLSILRYMVPVMGLMMLFVATAANQLWSRRSS